MDFDSVIRIKLFYWFEDILFRTLHPTKAGVLLKVKGGSQKCADANNEA